MEWFWVVFHSLLSWFWAHVEPWKQGLLVVTSHSFVIVAFEEYNLCDFLLVNTIASFHELWMFHFLLVFKLFPIGYGSTPSKRKGIVLEQEIVKGLACRKGESFWRKAFSLQGCKESRSSFLKAWEVWKRFLQSFVSFSSLFFFFLKVSSFKVKVCGREFFNSLKVWGVWKKGLWVWGKALSLQGCKESRSPFLSEWEVWKRFLQVFLKVASFKWNFKLA
jgi:hypothetical protein